MLAGLDRGDLDALDAALAAESPDHALGPAETRAFVLRRVLGIAPGRSSFVQPPARPVAHGGISIEEVIVPFVEIDRP